MRLLFIGDVVGRSGRAAIERHLPGLRDRALYEFQKAYGLFNVRLAYETEDGAWTVTGFVNNIADEEYLLDAGNVGDSFTIPTFIRGPGRTAGVEIAAKF